MAIIKCNMHKKTMAPGKCKIDCVLWRRMWSTI